MISFGSAFSASNGPPGTECISRNVISVISRITTPFRNIRRMMYWVISYLTPDLHAHSHYSTIPCGSVAHTIIQAPDPVRSTSRIRPGP